MQGETTPWHAAIVISFSLISRQVEHFECLLVFFFFPCEALLDLLSLFSCPSILLILLF